MWRLGTRVALSLAMSGCIPASFLGSAPPGSAPSKEASPRAAAIPQPSFSVLELRTTAWWKSCIIVYLNGDETKPIPVGCNKLATGAGAPPMLQAVSLPVAGRECTTLRVQMDVYLPQDGACTQSEGTCDGPYQSVPSYSRSTKRLSDAKAFLWFDERDLEQVPDIVALTPEQRAELPALAKTAAQRAQEGIFAVRGYLEDQSDKNFTAAQGQSPSTKRSLGIDYVDYVLRLSLRGSKVAIEQPDRILSSILCKYL